MSDEDVKLPESIRLALEVIQLAVLNRQLTIVPLTSDNTEGPRRIVYAIGVYREGAGMFSFDPVAVVPHASRFDALRPATAQDLREAGHIPTVNGQRVLT